MTKDDFHTQIKGREYNNYVYTDVYDDDGVWLNTTCAGGNTRIILTKSQAKDLIASLISIVNHLEAE